MKQLFHFGLFVALPLVVFVLLDALKGCGL